MASLSTQTPQARGFATTLNYFDSGNNYYDSTTDQDCLDPGGDEVIAVDLWDTTGPARHLNGSYEESLFAARALETIRDHDTSRGSMFLYYAFHTSCTGYNGA
jgi:hypothetical protein